jgi:pseudaminic acid synthase
MNPQFNIGARQIGKGYPTYIIAELSCNHNQKLDLALELIKLAAESGADAVKLQTYRPDTITIDSDREEFMIKGTIWDGMNLFKLYQRTYTPWEWTPILMAEAKKYGLDLFSSPFDTTAVDFLETCNVDAYKVASFEIVDHILLKRIAQTKKPVIVSTGMASLSEIEAAVNCLKTHGSGPIALLKCTSAYPAIPEDANLANIPNLRDTFNVVPGLSDHTIGPEVPIVAVTLGANIIEKHFTVSRDSGSEDDEFSLTPSEFKSMVDSVRITEKSIGRVTYGGVANEIHTRALRRSLFAVEDIPTGQPFTPQNVRSIRPGGGLHTQHYDEILQKRARVDISRGTPLNWDLIDGN